MPTKDKMVSSLAVIDDDLANADIESLFSVDDEATPKTVLAFSIDDSDSKLDYSSESDEFDTFPYEIQTFEFSNILLTNPLPKSKLCLTNMNDPYQ